MPEVEIECLKCEAVWATIKFEFNSELNAKDIHIKSEFKHKIKGFKKGDTVICPKCGFEYRYVDLIMAITKRLPKIKVVK